MLYITPSLYEAVRWFIAIDDKPYQELLDTLNKVSTPPNEAMLNGIQFEDDICAYCAGKSVQDMAIEEPYAECVKEIGGIVSGTVLWQQPVSKPIIIGSEPYMLFGKTDVIKRDWIYDIKFTSSWEPGKYMQSIQHLVYMYATDIPNFAYLPSDGRSVYREDYHWSESAYTRLHSKCAELISYLKGDPVLWAAYQKNWIFENRKPRKEEENELYTNVG